MGLPMTARSPVLQALGDLAVEARMAGCLGEAAVARAADVADDRVRRAAVEQRVEERRRPRLA
jgi:hypothetical protein